MLYLRQDWLEKLSLQGQGEDNVSDHRDVMRDPEVSGVRSQQGAGTAGTERSSEHKRPKQREDVSTQRQLLPP